MNSPDPNLSDKSDGDDVLPVNSKVIDNQKTDTSATTGDVPAFGWSAYAERVNGRFAMIGFTAILLIEALSHTTFLHWAGLVS